MCAGTTKYIYTYGEDTKFRTFAATPTQHSQSFRPRAIIQNKYYRYIMCVHAMGRSGRNHITSLPQQRFLTATRILFNRYIYIYIYNALLHYIQYREIMWSQFSSILVFYCFLRCIMRWAFKVESARNASQVRNDDYEDNDGDIVSARLYYDGTIILFYYNMYAFPFSSASVLSVILYAYLCINVHTLL